MSSGSPRRQFVAGAIAAISAPNLHLVHHEYDQAIDLYPRTTAALSPGPTSLVCAWKAAWFTLRQGHNENAKTQFEEQIARYPSGRRFPPLCTGALALQRKTTIRSWRGRTTKSFSERYRNYTTQNWDGQRLERMPQPADPQHYALLDRVRRSTAGGKVTASERPPTIWRVQKHNCSQTRWWTSRCASCRRRLLPMAAAGLRLKTAQLYLANGHYDRGIQVIETFRREYFSLDIPDLPRPYWSIVSQGLLAELKRFSTGNDLILIA